MAYATQFTYLATIWWLNSLCTDIWKTFRSVTRGLSNMADIKYGWQHPSFKYYAMWSYFMPLCITGFTFCMENFINNYEDTIFHPGIGTESCFLGNEGILLYLIVPTTPILVINFTFFVLTTWNLCCGIWSQDDEKFKNVSKMASSIIKIFLATGISWIAEVVSWSLYYFFNNEELILTIAFPFDVVNALSGVTLFLAIVLDQKAISLIKKMNPKRIFKGLWFAIRRAKTAEYNMETIVIGEKHSCYKKISVTEEI